MCGIAGSVNYFLDKEVVHEYLHHRGPDERGNFSHREVQLFVNRLSIQDVSMGKQPFQSERGLTVVFNGEIYNHQTLREEHFLNCKTNSDVETFLRLYEKHGEKALNLIDGMFAFAIHDKPQNTLILGRDRAGEKPIYYFYDKTRFVFASELNTLSKVLPLAINENALADYFRLGYLYGATTPYRQVFELEPGFVLNLDINSFTLSKNKFWDIGDFYLKPKIQDFKESVAAVEEKLIQSVKQCVESSEHEVGSFLSGGIDSGLVTAIASKYITKIKTFTVGIAGKNDESPMAQLVSNQYETIPNIIKIDEKQLVNDIETILCQYGEPFFDSSAIPSYYISREAKKQVAVVLTGDGADELFAGYRRYVPLAKYDISQPNQLLKGIADIALNYLPEAQEKRTPFGYFRRLLVQASKDGVNAWLSAMHDVMEGHEARLNDPEVSQSLIDEFNAIYRQPIEPLSKSLWLDFKTILPGDFLVKMDIASMAHSLEARNPFLSKSMLELAPQIRSDFKIRGFQTKVVLRELAKKYLPSQHWKQPKKGFEIPLRNWVEGILKEIIFDKLRSKDAYYPQYIDKGFIESLLSNKISMDPERKAKICWMLFSFEVWHKHFIRNQLMVKDNMNKYE